MPIVVTLSVGKTSDGPPADRSLPGAVGRGDKKKDDEATTYSPALGSTIGAWELNGRVRDGNGCGLPAIITSSKSTGDLTMG